MIKSTVQE